MLAPASPGGIELNKNALVLLGCSRLGFLHKLIGSRFFSGHARNCSESKQHAERELGSHTVDYESDSDLVPENPKKQVPSVLFPPRCVSTLLEQVRLEICDIRRQWLEHRLVRVRIMVAVNCDNGALD